MKSSVLGAVLGVCMALTWGAGYAAAQDAWPNKPVRLVVPYAPGGASDTLARPWAEKLSQTLGQQFVVENKGGAGGQLGNEAAAKSAPDGYTFLLGPNAPMTVLPHLRKVPYDPFKDFVSVARAGDLVCGFAINPSVPVNSLQELIAYTKAHPGTVNYGSAGLGRPRICASRCSSCAPAPICCTCPIAAARRLSTTCSAVMSR